MLRHTSGLWLALILLVWVAMARAAAQTAPAAPALPAAPVDAPAQRIGTPAEVGRAIFAELERRHNSAYADFEVSLRMILTTRKGKVTQRELRIRQLEIPAAGDQVLLVFDQPANIRGTALLSHSQMQGADDQWLYLPALARVKKIASRNKSGAFVGSEFSYEDLTAPELDKYQYQWLRDEPCGELLCHVVERIAKDPYSGYQRELHWIDEQHFRAWRVEYYDKRRQALAKVLQLSDYRPYFDAQQSERWKPHRMHMLNERTQSHTELLWSDYAFGQGLTHERDFSVSSLRRAR
ncbi:MAG: outer membrane lipoprotein-sorting protein [Pseudomonadota bacterium]